MSDRSSTPRVSVVIPVRDDADALRACLRRVAAQTMAPLEVIVVDNDSSDGSADVARAAGAAVLHVTLPGIAGTAARGYDAATGDVIARCDADSLVPSDWVERIATAFAADPALDALTGPGRFHDLPRPWRGLASAAYAVGIFGVAGAAVANVPVWGSNMALRRSAWQAIAGRVARDDPAVHDDLDVSMRLGPDARVRLDPSLLVEAQGRMFRSRADVARRFSAAMRTFRLGWAEEGSPGRRWLRRLRPRTRPDSR